MSEELKHFLSLLNKGNRSYKFDGNTFVLYNEKGVDIYRGYDAIARNCEQVCIQLGVPTKQ